LDSIFTPDYDRFLTSLITARKDAGLTQAQLAGRLGKPQSFVSKYERRERRLDVVEFVAIARALEIDACAIVRNVETHMAARGRAAR
jgi:transcriptional regulator with XRE-family HTH domain